MNWKIWLLIFVVLGSILAIVPLNFEKGVEIVSIEQNSTAYEQGLRQGQIITQIDGQNILSFEDYKEVINSKVFLNENQKTTIEYICKLIKDYISIYYMLLFFKFKLFKQ